VGVVGLLGRRFVKARKSHPIHNRETVIREGNTQKCPPPGKEWGMVNGRGRGKKSHIPGKKKGGSSAKRLHRVVKKEKKNGGIDAERREGEC